ncbi:MAG: hypothetical protein WC223_10630 [Bacteroidales bacterium]|jgi:hypothetical protein
MKKSKCEITKLNISVQVLRVENKQATQSFIKQVQLKWWFNFKEIHQYKILGHINYFPEKEKQYKYYHLLFINKKDELCRAYVEKKFLEEETKLNIKQIFIAC